MPRPLWIPLLGATALAALPPALFHAALAATAGSLFEAAPFVLVAEALGAIRVRGLAVLAEAAGCGCGVRFPGALSLPATALAWLTFGPWVALGRIAAAVACGAATARRQSSPCAEHEPSTGSDPLADLAALAPAAFAAFLAAQVLGAEAAALHAAGPAGAAFAFGAGLALGYVVPCATAGVAIAAAFAGPLPPAAAGLLASAGLLVRRRPASSAGTKGRTTRFAGLLLTVALAALALHGPSGLVNPRFVLPAGAAAVLAALRFGRWKTGPSAGVLAPALMLAALVTGSPPPAYRLDATEAAAAYPGSRLTFSGVALDDGRTTVVERFAIACCRLDATPVTVKLDRRIGVPAGAWLTVEGIVVREATGALVLHPRGWRRTPRPADPFFYR